MNLQSTFGYFIITQTLNIALCKRDGITDRQTGRRTDRRTIRLLDAPGGPFRPWALKCWIQMDRQMDGGIDR